MTGHRSTRPPFRARRTRALLAGGLVLGLGATSTLASWTDDEHAHAHFSSSRFDVESSVDGTIYADHPAAPGATITFHGTDMSPGSHRYGFLLIRTRAGSEAGTLTLGAAAVTNGTGDTAPLLGTALTYRAVETTGSCDASAFAGTPQWVTGQAGHVALTVPGGVTLPLAAAPEAAPGQPTGLCFDVMLPTGADNALQGKTATVVWRITATSDN